MKKTIGLLVLLVTLIQVAKSQDLEKLAKLKPKDLLKGKGLSISGSVTANNRYYMPKGIPNRQVNYQYIYSGRLVVDLFGKIKMPVSFSFTNQKATFAAASLRGILPVAQPFNRLSFKPTYKGSTLHLGTCALTFSPFSLAGFRYNGVGYEYKSKKFPVYGGLMYGTLFKPVGIALVPEAYPNNKPAYKRMGMGAKLGLQKKQDFIEFSLFKADDQLNSLPYRLDSKNIFPFKNVAITAGFQKVLKEKWFLRTEIGRSRLWQLGNPVVSPSAFGNDLASLFQPTKNRLYQQAIKAGVEYKEDKRNIGVEYSRIDPKYTTLGGYFFNKDIETIALKTAFKLKESKLNLTGDIGLQRTNLDLSIPQTQKRVVWNAAVNYTPSEKVNLGFNYSTFTSFSNFQNQFLYLKAIDPFQDLDTLIYRQINQNIGINLRLQLPSANTKIKRSIQTAAIYQGGTDQQGNNLQKNKLVNFNVNYGIANEDKKLNQSFGVNLVKNNNTQSQNFMWGPMYSLALPLLKGKVQMTSNLTYTDSQTKMTEPNSTNHQQIGLGTLGFQTAIKKKHKLTFTTMYLRTMNPLKKNTVGQNFSELTFNLGYAYSFKLLDIKFK